ncbi:site-specific integrase [Halobacterium sp. NMX12-1]|uniref:Site-specific integrase n=1 Tax=Halobacterium sp. NMX12-1 TaxID=3166650 RepID=A0AAU8CCF8_9EURY
MRLQPFNETDGYRVWLSDDELQSLIDEVEGPGQRVGTKLGARAGLRREEASLSRPVDTVQGPGGHWLRVWENQSKRDVYRETPIPQRLAIEIETLADLNDIDPDETVVNVTPKTLNRWVQRAAERRHGATGDDGWLEVSYHDLRRTWGTRLLEQGVLPTVVMSWGGWKDWETFRKHYLGEFSPEAMKRERGKVEFLGGESVDTGDSQNHLIPVGRTLRQQS